MSFGNGSNRYYVLYRSPTNSVAVAKYYVWANNQREADMLAESLYGKQNLITTNAVYDPDYRR